ncbi:tRNA (5-methylaminomethyl-2-thiouridine)(34)-methyltransferase MnmD [Cyanobacterium sp. uoEpiScrs1]|uniref:tRNA (5-methylaminomethyl-2-thiouridine)(34)-methyltransferase MnmD n=1 Tax=Cyanobacterium sp. uoEpiScrs1 TaxID=2976343 RepID=UPI002269D7E0|nr:MnmC family methyltransferase [Cyanobacterium sp. uoEpiScrs1]
MFTPQLTDDGSYTFFSEQFKELFHSHSGAKLEAEQKFVSPCQLEEKAKRHMSLKILDVCYGLGYNSAAALEKVWSINQKCHIELIALESDINVPYQSGIYHLLEQWPSSVRAPLTQLTRNYAIQTSRLRANLLIGDARNTIQTIYQSGFKADAIFLDPFSPPKCPQLWTLEFIKIVSGCLNPQGRLGTYSSAAAVRTALQLAGLIVSSTKGVGRRSPGTIAGFDYQDLCPLSVREEEHLKTRAAIPYRDPNLQDSAMVIHQRRRIEQVSSDLEPTSHWKKRWKDSV